MAENNNKKLEYSFSYEKLNQNDLNLVEAAIKVLKVNFHPIKHQISCALMAESGQIYTGVNVRSSTYGPCAEAIAIGKAIANGDNSFAAIVAIKKIEENYPVFSPCGSCRQLIFDYAPNATVIFSLDGQAVKAKAKDLLPGPYENSFTAIARSGSGNLS